MKVKELKELISGIPQYLDDYDVYEYLGESTDHHPVVDVDYYYCVGGHVFYLELKEVNSNGE